jgi:hypothetical protein
MSSLSRLSIPMGDAGYRSSRTDGYLTPGGYRATSAIDGTHRTPLAEGYYRTPALASGCYRVRNLNPSCVLTLSAPDKVYVDHQDGWMRLAQAVSHA